MKISKFGKMDIKTGDLVKLQDGEVFKVVVDFRDKKETHYLFENKDIDFMVVGHDDFETLTLREVEEKDIVEVV